MRGIIKKVAFCTFLGLSSISFILSANEIVYSTTVKNLYLDASGTKEYGKLLPTTKVEILSKEGNRVKIKVQGFAKEGVNNALYFSAGKRILNAAFIKGANFDLKVLKSEKVGNETYNLVEATVFTDSSDFTQDLKGLYAKADEMYSQTCSMCHGLHDKKEFKSNQWPGVINAMSSRAGLSADDKHFITQYMQKHASDM